MTYKEAINHFKDQLEIFGGEHHEAMKVAIEALEKQNSCKDCAGCTQWKCDCANVRAEVCDRIIEQLEDEIKQLPHIQYWRDEKKCYIKAIAIVKGVQND